MFFEDSMQLAQCSLAALVIGFSFSVLAADSAKETAVREAGCVTAINEQTAALVAQDWQSLERISDAYLKACKGVLDAEGLSEAHAGISNANNKLGKPRKALAAADTCIQISYSNTGCHLQRFLSLVALKRLSDAQQTLDRVDRLLEHKQKVAKRELETSQNATDKEWLSARINNFDAQQSRAQTLRALHFPN